MDQFPLPHWPGASWPISWLSCCCHNNTFLIGRHGGSTNNIFFPSFHFVRWIVTLWSNADQLLGHKSCHRWCLWTWMLSYRPDISSVTVPRPPKSFAHSRNPPLSSHYLCVASRNQVVGLAHKFWRDDKQRLPILGHLHQWSREDEGNKLATWQGNKNEGSVAWGQIIIDLFISINREPGAQWELVLQYIT